MEEDWKHPGGKPAELGAECLSEEEIRAKALRLPDFSILRTLLGAHQTILGG